MKTTKRKGELVFLFLLLFILSLLVTQIVMAIRQAQTEDVARDHRQPTANAQAFVE